MEGTPLSTILKKWTDAIGNATLFLVNYTIIFIPFFLFIKLSDGKNITTTLPFVLFYCLRLTGIFLFRSIKNTVNSLCLLLLSLTFSLFGCFLATLGSFYFPCYFFSSIFLGLGASWVIPAEISVTYYERQKGESSQPNYPLILLIIGLFFAVFHFFPNPTIIFSVYSLFFIFSILAVQNFSSYNLTAPVEDPELSKREFVSFLIFFSLLFFLRTGRLIENTQFFDYAIIAASIFFLIFILFRSRIIKNLPNKVPPYLRLLATANGFISNYLFLFGSIYVIGTYGEGEVTKKIFLPFFLGMTLGMYLLPKIKVLWGDKLKDYSLIAMFFCLFLILMNLSITLGIFLISFFRTTFNSWVTSAFYQSEGIPQDKRVLTKFTFQNRGSMLHQFLLMGIILLLSKFDQTSIRMFLILEVTKQSNPPMHKLVHQANYIASTLIMLLIVACFIYEKIEKRKN